MKLVNLTLLYLSSILFISAGIWGILFYHQILGQVKSTIDSGLENYKIVLIDKLKEDSLVVERNTIRDNNYLLKKVDEDYALKVRDTYKDTLIRSELKNASYQTRLLTTAFRHSEGAYYELRIVSQELSREDLIRKIAYSLLLLFLFLLVSTLLINNLVLKKTWKPFYNLLGFLKKFRLEKGEPYKPGKSNIKEFALLNESVSNLVEDNIGIYNKQKQFIENASHELQTPLAISINKLELLANGKNIDQENIHKIGEIISILEGQADLNKALLLLSKIENRMFADYGPVNLDDLINRTLNVISDLAEHRKIKITYNPEGDWHPEMSRDLAEIMLMNLVKNAVIHNTEEGLIVITLSSSCLKVENTSSEKEIPAGKIFERFTRNSRNKNSSGLGLAIIKAVADNAGLVVRYTYNGNHIFEVCHGEIR
jgi:signal transduction histidine kinase